MTNGITVVERHFQYPRDTEVSRIVPAVLAAWHAQLHATHDHVIVCVFGLDAILDHGRDDHGVAEDLRFTGAHTHGLDNFLREPVGRVLMETNGDPRLSKACMRDHVDEHAGKLVGGIFATGANSAQCDRGCAETATAVGLGGDPVA